MTAGAVREPEPTTDERTRNRDWILLAWATLAFSFGFGIYSGVSPNFQAEYLRIPRAQLGLLESLREIPGLLTAGIVAILAGLAEPRLARLSLAILAIGIGVTGQVRRYWDLVACSVFWSIGLHIWLTVQPAMALTLSPEGHHGHRLGMLQRYGSFAILGGLLFVAATGRLISYGLAFALAGAAISLGCIATARISSACGGGLEQRVVFRPRYRLYYLLALLDGGRRVMVQTFALLILVREFQVGRQAVASLMLLTSALMMVFSPVVGRWIDRWGERRVLSLYYLAVVGTFAAYTQVQSAAAFCAVYALDALLFTCAVGIPTYARHLCPREDLSPTLAMGLTMNHVAAVTVPVTAGALWELLGYRTIFWGGVGLALVSLFSCQLLPRNDQGQGSE